MEVREKLQAIHFLTEKILRIFIRRKKQMFWRKSHIPLEIMLKNWYLTMWTQALQALKTCTQHNKLQVAIFILNSWTWTYAAWYN